MEGAGGREEAIAAGGSHRFRDGVDSQRAKLGNIVDRNNITLKDCALR